MTGTLDLLSEGATAPDFTLPDEDAREHKLSDYRGSPVVLFFYPRDDTPGCIKEVCNFRDDYSAYQEAGVVLLGVSDDDTKSHTRFKSKYSLPFTLLADVGHKISELYGVWGGKKLFGWEYDGIIRTTYLIDAEGSIAKVFERVDPVVHSAEVLEALKAL
jgi:peroxiredoxin Q/BCP